MKEDHTNQIWRAITSKKKPCIAWSDFTFLHLTIPPLLVNHIIFTLAPRTMIWCLCTCAAGFASSVHDRVDFSTFLLRVIWQLSLVQEIFMKCALKIILSSGWVELDTFSSGHMHMLSTVGCSTYTPNIMIGLVWVHTYRSLCRGSRVAAAAARHSSNTRFPYILRPLELFLSSVLFCGKNF